MAQEALNSTNNINLAHNVSIWFQRDFAGDYNELGDLVVDGVNLAPEFSDFRSYRNGINALRKRLLTNRAATITATLNEPSISNLEKVLFGTTPVGSQTITAREGKHLTVQDGGSGQIQVDMDDAGETDFTALTITGIFDATDALLATNKISANIIPNTDGLVLFDETDSSTDIGDIVYVVYEIALTGMTSTTIYGATNATVEGAAVFQSRNLGGGVIQIWDLASVSLAPNGDISYPVDSHQTVPISMTLQERSGTFGKVYTK